MNRPLILLFAIVSLSALLRPALCQSTDFKTLLSGNTPLTLTLKDMNGTWRSLTLGTSAGANDPTQAYLAWFSDSAGVSTCYTRGETVAAGGEIFLVTYHRQIKIDLRSITRFGSDIPDIPKLTPDTPLSLSLLNVRAVSSLSDIQPVTLGRELGDVRQAGPNLAALDPEQTSVSNLKQIGLAVSQYAQDNDEDLPSMNSATVVKAALFPFVKFDATFQQPRTHKPYLPNTSLSRRSLSSFDSPATMVIYYEGDPAPDGLRAVLFLDGHVERLDAAGWQRVKTASHVPDPH